MSHHKACNYAAGNKFRLGLIKRESGENPERSRHCISWSEARCHWGIYSGKAPRMEMLKSGDLLFLCKDSCGRREIFTNIIDRKGYIVRKQEQYNCIFYVKRLSDLAQDVRSFFV